MRCAICGKRFMSGSKVSHSNIHTKTKFNANIQKVSAVVDGRKCRLQVCTSCIRSNKVTKA